jgi:hypothetical protein
MSYRRVAIVLIIVISLTLPMSVFAGDDLTVSVEYIEKCGDTAMTVDILGGDGPFNIVVKFGDGESIEIPDVFTIPYTLHHMYPSQGEFEYSIKVYGLGGTEGEAEGIVEVVGPDVVLESDPTPPLLPLGSEGTKIDFTAIVSGGQVPFAFEWDLNGDGVPDETADPTSNTATFTYTEANKLAAYVKVTDACGFAEDDELTVYIIDPTAEEDPDADAGEDGEGGEDISSEDEVDAEKGCHPTAQRIADALSILSPDQREGEYNCEDIFNFFQDEEGGLHHSFGLLWRAYQMTQIIDELTWEDILDWHLEGSGWGTLQQLNRFAESLDEVSITELYELVMNGGSTMGDIRSALKAALRYEADFNDALQRLEGGTSPGELNQLYRTAMEMGIEPSLLDEYLETGVSLSQIKHASKLADQTGSEWQILLGAYTSGYDWGEIRKAFRLADESTDFETILAIGANAYRDQQRELERAERNLEQDERTAKRLAEQYGVEYNEILELLDLICGGDWNCMRELLRDQAKAERNAGHEDSTAIQIAEKYGVLESDVWNVYVGQCGGKWSCVREYFRDQTKKDNGKGPK